MHKQQIDWSSQATAAGAVEYIERRTGKLCNSFKHTIEIYVRLYVVLVRIRTLKTTNYNSEQATKA